MLKLAYKYMRYYKSQTFAIMASIILTAALLSGISSLMYSSQKSDLANDKTIYGNWHYSIAAEQAISKTIRTGEQGAGFFLEQCGKKEIKDMSRTPYLIYFVYADEAYRQMAHRELVEGRYPQAADEIAADYYTLGNLGLSDKIGSRFNLNGKDYTLTGIVKGEWSAEEMEFFVGEDFAGQGSQSLLYLRFDESKKLYKQLAAFLQEYQISGDAVSANDEVVKYLGGEQPDSIYHILNFALTNEQGNFTYIVLKLQSEYNLAFHGMIFLLCLFSLFVIYSVFHISVYQRRAEYGMLQTLGISEQKIGCTLVIELWMLFLIGYPTGCLLGNGSLKILHQQLSAVFASKAIGKAEIGAKISKTEQIFALEGSNAAKFHIAWNAIGGGFIFLLASLAVIAFFTVYSMRKQSLRQTMAGDISFIKRNRKIYSRRSYGLANVVVRKFMFSNKRKVIGILLSLSIGGCIFLCTTYMVENLKIHAELSMKSDDGLGAEYRISVKSNYLSDTLPAALVDEIKHMPELSNIYATKYSLGELTIRKNELEWDTYFDEKNQDSYFQQRFGGICVEKENGTYGIKYDIYGYDEAMIEQLQEFILEGEIAAENLEQGNKIIAVANKDGQGNYNFYGKHLGDTITLRVPKNLDCPEEVLKFENSEKDDEDYIEKEFQIAAIVSRALAKEDHFLNAEGWSDSQSFILTNQQMDSLFGIADYSFVQASPAYGADTARASSQLLQKIKDVPKAALQDYTTAIETQKNYLRQQQLFFTGIAAILLVISSFHILNSMHYSILSHRREYGIIRAMGITDSGFYKMIARTGLLYGLLTDLLIFFIYHLVLRKIMDYYMVHVVQFLHFNAEIPKGIVAIVMALNLLIAVLAVMLPARKIVRASIISEIKGKG